MKTNDSDNIITFPGAKTDEELAYFRERCSELKADLLRDWDAECNAGGSRIEFLLSKIAALQAGLELTMKTVIARTK